MNFVENKLRKGMEGWMSGSMSIGGMEGELPRLMPVFQIVLFIRCL
jgi:hypothetical protein